MDSEKLSNYIKNNFIKVVETEIGDVVILNEGILYVNLHRNLDIDLELALNYRNIVLSEFNGPFSVICDSRNFNGQVPIETINQFINDEEFNSKCSFQAIINNNLAYGIMGNFYLNFLQKSVSAKLFKNEDDALNWILVNFKTTLNNQNMELG